MRKALHARVRPLVERLAKDLTETAVARVEAELERMKEAFEVALSAFASEEPDDDSDRRDHDPVPQVRRSARRGLHDGGARTGPGPDPRAAQAADPRRAEGQRAAGLVVAPSDLPTVREVFGAGSRWRELDNLPIHVVAPQANGKKPVTCSRHGLVAPCIECAVPQRDGRKPTTCSKCGYVGGNARGCGRSHPTQAASDKPLDVEAAPARSAATPARLAAIAALSKKQPEPPRPQAVEPVEDDDSEERWSQQRIAEERERAEGSKHDGELPRPRASFRVDDGEVSELDFGGRD